MSDHVDQVLKVLYHRRTVLDKAVVRLEKQLGMLSVQRSIALSVRKESWRERLRAAKLS